MVKNVIIGIKEINGSANYKEDCYFSSKEAFSNYCKRS